MGTVVVEKQIQSRSHFVCTGSFTAECYSDMCNTGLGFGFGFARAFLNRGVEFLGD